VNILREKLYEKVFFKMIKNNYNFNGMWLRGNLHTHTKNSPCGHYDIEKVIEMYTSHKMYYDFLAITDHYMLTNLENYIDDDKLILFHGTEYKEGPLQTLGINIKEYNDDKNNLTNHQEIFNDVVKQGGVNIICHPHMYRDDYWPFNKLIELDNYVGIEVFNNNVKHDNKWRAVASDVWDELLSSGKAIYGFANDDMHVFPRAGGGFNMVLVEDRSREAIIKSIKNGSFYASSGVFIEEIAVEDNEIKIRAAKVPVTFRFIGKNGQVHYECFGFDGVYNCKGDEGYIRVELLREDGARAWTQPFYIV